MTLTSYRSISARRAQNSNNSNITQSNNLNTDLNTTNRSYKRDVSEDFVKRFKMVL